MGPKLTQQSYNFYIQTVWQRGIDMSVLNGIWTKSSVWSRNYSFKYTQCVCKSNNNKFIDEDDTGDCLLWQPQSKWLAVFTFSAGDEW